MLWQKTAIRNLIRTAMFRFALFSCVVADGLAAACWIVDVDAELCVKYNGVRELRTFDAVLFLQSCTSFETPCFADSNAARHQFRIHMFEAWQFTTEKFDDLERLTSAVYFRSCQIRRLNSVNAIDLRCVHNGATRQRTCIQSPYRHGRP